MLSASQEPRFSTFYEVHAARCRQARDRSRSLLPPPWCHSSSSASVVFHLRSLPPGLSQLLNSLADLLSGTGEPSYDPMGGLSRDGVCTFLMRQSRCGGLAPLPPTLLHAKEGSPLTSLHMSLTCGACLLSLIWLGTSHWGREDKSRTCSNWCPCNMHVSHGGFSVCEVMIFGGKRIHRRLDNCI